MNWTHGAMDPASEIRETIKTLGQLEGIFQNASAWHFHPVLDVHFPDNQMGLHYGPGTFDPRPEHRSLDSIRPSLRDPSCTGPDPVYAIAMDVGRTEDLSALKQRMLLLALLSARPES
jgi:hypothetical protein